MKRIVVGILAHVDAGKTTLSEGILYTSGKIRQMGRVDNRDSFFDNYELERTRGITIFSKQAELEYGDVHISLLDTPGHVDFSAEMERTLQILDYAVLVVSGADGIQGHTSTLWYLLRKYNVPCFIFVNKMDQEGTDKDKLINELKTKLSDNCIEFREDIINNIELADEEFFDSIAMCDEGAMEEFIENGKISDKSIAGLIKDRKTFPCIFGSALKMDGVDSLLKLIDRYSVDNSYPKELGLRVYKISRDEQDNRLTHFKVTGGCLKVKDLIQTKSWSEKINQIRIYSGNKYIMVNEIEAGAVCAVTGLTKTFVGEGIGYEESNTKPILVPLLNYKVEFEEGVNLSQAIIKLRQLEEEDPELHIIWNEELQEINIQMMGEVQIEVLKNIIANRFKLNVEFGQGSIVYKETIKNTVEGVGHFEPLRHYAEAHLLLEPGEVGSGMVFDTNCSEDILDKNWQRLILTHLTEKEYVGVLTKSPITDMKITLVGGRAHQKHTEGGDFRQAVYRAVRQGLMQAESVLLEPYYEFTLEVPTENVGRAMSDIDKMNGTFELSQNNNGDTEYSVIVGEAPVVCMNNYKQEFISYTRGKGRMFTTFAGYRECHNQEEVIAKIGYDPYRDVENTPDSVFCAHGAGFIVSWDKVFDYMHVESYFSNNKGNQTIQDIEKIVYPTQNKEEEWLGTEEIDNILDKTFYANSQDKVVKRKNVKVSKKENDYSGYKADFRVKNNLNKEKYLLVDGYNIIFAWDELKEIADVNIDGARGRLLDIMCNYQAIIKSEIIVVFDAYRIKGHQTEVIEYNNIHVVYTKEAETADSYIEKFAHNNSEKYNITVATSDALEQIIIRGEGCMLMSARDLLADVRQKEDNLRENYIQKTKSEKNLLGNLIPNEIK